MLMAPAFHREGIKERRRRRRALYFVVGRQWTKRCIHDALRRGAPSCFRERLAVLKGIGATRLSFFNHQIYSNTSERIDSPLGVFGLIAVV